MAPRRRGNKWTVKKKKQIIPSNEKARKLSWSEALNTIYESLGKAGAFSSTPSTLKQELKNNFDIDDVSLTQIKQWLEGKLSHSIHKRADVHFTRNPIIAPRRNYQWQGDLMFLPKLRRFNKGFWVVLVVIDVVSRFAWAHIMKNKSGPATTKAFEQILKQAHPERPVKFQTDKGTEFMNKGFQQMLHKNKIIYFNTYSDTKAAIAERFVQTVKKMIFKYLTENQTNVYWDKLQDFLDTYNSTVHSSTKFAPNQVNDSNEGEVLSNLYGYLWQTDMLHEHTPKFHVGAYVRVSRVGSNLFRKSYTGNWTDEIFQIQTIKDTYPRITYGLIDLKQNEIMGSYYDNELQQVSDLDIKASTWTPHSIQAERILHDGTKEYLVQWTKSPWNVNWVPAYKLKHR